jgi:hypothetical protein
MDLDKCFWIIGNSNKYSTLYNNSKKISPAFSGTHIYKLAYSFTSFSTFMPLSVAIFIK